MAALSSDNLQMHLLPSADIYAKSLVVSALNIDQQ